MTDELNILNEQPAAELPPGANVGPSEAAARRRQPQSAAPQGEAARAARVRLAERPRRNRRWWNRPSPKCRPRSSLRSPKRRRPSPFHRSRPWPKRRRPSRSAGRCGHRRAAAPPAPPPEPKSDKMDWYILKVQSNREDSIREGFAARGHRRFGPLLRRRYRPHRKGHRVQRGKEEGHQAEACIRAIWWCTWRSTTTRGSWSARRRASAISPGPPATPARCSRTKSPGSSPRQEEKSEKSPKLKIAFREGDRVKINEGTFENFEGEVDSIDETNGRVTVMINIFGRSTPGRIGILAD